MQLLRPIRSALISVSDKNDIINFAHFLFNKGIKIFSTSGTARLLIESGLHVVEIADYIDFPEIMNGRLKTLHPKILGGILGRRDIDNTIMHEYGMTPIDMVIVNLYSFYSAIKDVDCTYEDAINNIDIGGHTLVRSAAKNYKDVVVLVNSQDYISVMSEMDQHNGAVTITTRFNLAIKAFEHIAFYDSIIANYFINKKLKHQCDRERSSHYFPDVLNINFIKKQDMRYGENNHQLSAFYIHSKQYESSVVTARQIQGKKLSYNNVIDVDTALECVKNFTDIACVIVKHANPCGVALGKTLLEAYNRAYNTDPMSMFGGIIAFNYILDADTTQMIIENQFVEVIIAPDITDDALKILAQKKNMRILVCGYWNKQFVSGLDFKSINGGLLVQERDINIVSLNKLNIVTERHPTEREIRDALFCWKVVKFVKSNAIVYARDQRTIGIGAGQMSRIYSAKIAVMKARDAGFDINGSVMASDAFIPFCDSINMAADVGISCIIQPGGSIRDNEIIAVANKHGMAMIFTHMRHLRH